VRLLAWRLQVPRRALYVVGEDGTEPKFYLDAFSKFPDPSSRYTFKRFINIIFFSFFFFFFLQPSMLVRDYLIGYPTTLASTGLLLNAGLGLPCFAVTRWRATSPTPQN
jgi:hypothetical protein